MGYSVEAGSTGDEIGILQRGIEVADLARGFEDFDAPHRPLAGLDTEPTRVHEDQILGTEVPHRSRDGPDVPLVLRLHEDDANRRHTALDILYNRYSLACGSPSRSPTTAARSSATSASRTGEPWKASASRPCVRGESSEIRERHSSGARVGRSGA